MKQGIQQFLIGIDKRTQLCRDGEDHMKVVSIDQLAAAPVNPELFQDRLAVRAVSVAAGVCMKLQTAAFPASADVVTECPGLTVHNAVSGFFLLFRWLEMPAVTIPAI